jgi:hypothetical protein
MINGVWQVDINVSDNIVPPPSGLSLTLTTQRLNPKRRAFNIASMNSWEFHDQLSKYHPSKDSVELFKSFYVLKFML